MWHQFALHDDLSDKQIALFKQYLSLTLSWNVKTNLTTITDPQKIIWYHFQDSLAVKRAVDMDAVTHILDVGSGGGFPGIPLAIAYPEKDIILIEVNHKKVAFLQEVITQLNLKNVMISDYDWRTFLRKTTYPAQLVCARASLRPKELIRMFQPSSSYNTAWLVYWASSQWDGAKEIKPFLWRDIAYNVGSRHRRLIVMKKGTE